MKERAMAFKPGMKVPVSGQYAYVGPRGKVYTKEVTSVKGEHFPPTPKPNMGYTLVDKTKHNR